MERISIILADDHKLVRETWSYILNTDPRLKVIGEFGNSAIAVEEAKTRQPNIVLMDVNILPLSGFEATEQIVQAVPNVRVIAVSMHSLPAYAKRMFEVGARGYITKNSSKEEMITAVFEVHSGKKYVCAEIKNNISEMVLDNQPSMNSAKCLTTREIDIIREIRKGSSSKEIAKTLNMSVKTVEVHRHNMLKKLNLKNSALLVNYCNLMQID